MQISMSVGVVQAMDAFLCVSSRACSRAVFGPQSLAGPRFDSSNHRHSFCLYLPLALDLYAEAVIFAKLAL